MQSGVSFFLTCSFPHSQYLKIQLIYHPRLINMRVSLSFLLMFSALLILIIFVVTSEVLIKKNKLLFRICNMICNRQEIRMMMVLMIQLIWTMTMMVFLTLKILMMIMMESQILVRRASFQKNDFLLIQVSHYASCPSSSAHYSHEFALSTKLILIGKTPGIEIWMIWDVFRP